MRPWAPCGRLRESRSGRRGAVPRHRQTTPRRCTAGSTPARVGWPRPWPHCDPGARASGHRGQCQHSCCPACCPACCDVPGGTFRSAIAPPIGHGAVRAAAGGGDAWVLRVVCDLHATKTSRARRHPKVPVPVESSAAAEGTKVPLCQYPAGGVHAAANCPTRTLRGLSGYLNFAAVLDAQAGSGGAMPSTASKRICWSGRGRSPFHTRAAVAVSGWSSSPTRTMSWVTKIMSHDTDTIKTGKRWYLCCHRRALWWPADEDRAPWPFGIDLFLRTGRASRPAHRHRDPGAVSQAGGKPRRPSALGPRPQPVLAASRRGYPRLWPTQAITQRIIVNLAGNALHYSPAAPPLLTPRTAGNRVELRVVDHGPGIPAADRKRVSLLPWQRSHSCS